MKNYSKLLVSLSIIFLWACISTPPYDQTEYDRVIRLKVKALNVLQNATQNSRDYITDINELKNEMAIMYEYAKNLLGNDEVIEQIEIMNNPDGSLLGKALKDWEINSTLNDIYLAGLLKNISNGFDQISGLISHRIKK
ncbi:MAG: hypothetical protein LBF62_09500 [Tannerellaceae bacterium]|jgi:hypothetical protein|nr:hypothetical protein [Tannerellaceae bacterium]